MASLKYYNKTTKQWEYVSSDSGSSDILIDNTLTQAGQAADAKVVGDALADKQPKGNYALKSEIPNVNGFLTEIPSEYVTETELSNKGFLTSYTETDPTVPAWAKASSKPNYNKSEVGLGNVENVKQYSVDNPPVVSQDKAPSDTSVIWIDTSDNSDDGFQEAVNYALAQAKASGEFDGKDGSDASVTSENIASVLGYTPANDADVDSLSSNQSTLSSRMDTFTTLKEGSTTGDAELIDARVDCEGKVWNNAGGHIRGITEKIIGACCDKVIVSGGNYNLFKMSEVMYSTRLQDDVEGTTSSTENNFVTGWIPVKYGKYYSVSLLWDGIRAISPYISYVRMNLKRQDGTIVVYNKNQVPTVLEHSKRVLNLLYEDVVAIRLHMGISKDGQSGVDVSTPEKLGAYQVMFVEGDTPEQAYLNALNFEYIDGDAEVPAEIGYTLKRDPTKADKAKVSPYSRSVNFGTVPFTYYQGMSDSYEVNGFTKNTKYTTFMAAWKALVANHSGYITETELGKASDGQSIYLYDFKPVRITNQNKPIPKIIVIAGQHGFEKSNVFGLYYFVGNLLNKWDQHPALEYLRTNVELMIIPVLNTYGFDTLEYKNANGVNTNRNFDSNWELVSDTTDPQYGGAEPFDQPETQIVRDLLTTNTDALMVVDFHTCGGTSVTKYEDVNWCGLTSSTDSYYNRMLEAVAHHLSSITAHFNSDYALNQPDVMMGHMTTNDGGGKLRNWATGSNIIGVLVEGFNGFPNDAEYAAKVFKANEEIIVNYLITALNYLAKGDKGIDGHTPEKGADYFTDADKLELVNAVIAGLPVYNGEVR